MHYFLVSNEKRASLNTRMKRRQCWPGRAGLGQAMEGRRVSKVTKVVSGRGCGALQEEGSLLEGQLIFLTAYFFICFIQFLQRVQQFLWGENVRGSWGRQKRQ